MGNQHLKPAKEIDKFKLFQTLDYHLGQFYYIEQICNALPPTQWNDVGMKTTLKKSVPENQTSSDFECIQVCVRYESFQCAHQTSKRMPISTHKISSIPFKYSFLRKFLELVSFSILLL